MGIQPVKQGLLSLLSSPFSLLDNVTRAVLIVMHPLISPWFHALWVQAYIFIPFCDVLAGTDLPCSSLRFDLYPSLTERTTLACAAERPAY